jgi:enamine deaminase RidA (YjgF/YER057c/UK114 family)
MAFSISEDRGRERLSSGKIWEEKNGYSRAVKVGRRIMVAGTMGYDEEGNYPESAEEQTENALQFIQQSLKMFSSSLRDVVRTHIYITNIDDQVEVGLVHRKAFEDIMPAATMVEVSALAAPEAKVEIEVEAILSRDEDSIDD